MRKQEPRTVLRRERRNAFRCPACNAVIDADFVNEKGEVRLVCGHVRSAILPSHGVSFEDVILRMPVADRLFPAIEKPRRDLADILGDVPQSVRDSWS